MSPNRRTVTCSNCAERQVVHTGRPLTWTCEFCTAILQTWCADCNRWFFVEDLTDDRCDRCARAAIPDLQVAC